MNSLHFYRQNNKKLNILSNAPYFTANVKEPEYKCVQNNYNLHENNYLQRSFSADNVVIRSRGFKPSDIQDPAKRDFLENLTTKILHVEMDGGEMKRIDLQKLLTPANDSEELLHTKNKKMYASSYFYAPSHPTVEDQVELARRISYSLSDVKNMKSKGQSMYVNRKKRSVKWIHDGNGVESDDEPETTPPTHKEKIPLKCMMNPNGKVLDIHGIQALGEDVNIEETPSHPEKLFDIVRDLNNQKGRGAEIFAKRRKRSEKWVVEKDESQVATPNQSAPGTPWKGPGVNFPRINQEADVKENSVLPPLVEPLPILTPLSYAPKSSTNNTCRPFYNPFTLDLSLSPVGPPTDGGNGYTQFPQKVHNNNVIKAKKTKNSNGGGGGRAGAATNGGGDYLMNSIAPKGNQEHWAENGSKKSGEMAKPKSNDRRKRSERIPSSDPRSVAIRNKSSSLPFGKSLYRDGFNGDGMTVSPHRNNGMRRNGRLDDKYTINNNNNHNNNYVSNDEEGDDDEEEEDDYASVVDKYAYEECENGVHDEYTPVPVKQLIKEFERTCRPAMQYKQHCNPAGKIAAQLCTLDNDMISRYFEGRSYVASSSSKHREAQDLNGVQENWNEPQACRRDPSANVRLPVQDQQQLLLQNHRNHGPAQEDIALYYAAKVRNEETASENCQQRTWRVKYIDEQEISSTDDSSDTTESSTPTPTPTPTPTGSLPFDGTNLYHRQQELIAREYYENDVDDCRRDSIASIGDPAEPPIHPSIDACNDNKPLVLAMVASEQDILHTIKQLRHTPVLNNLIPTNGAPDSVRLHDGFPNVEKKADENSGYQGPKLTCYQKLSNYNTAPRGWDQAHTYYRPITFGRPQEPIVYSDF